MDQKRLLTRIVPCARHLGYCLALFVLMNSSLLLKGATLSVTSLADSGPGTLRAAITAAGAGDTITFAVQGTIVLTNGTPYVGMLIIDKNLQIIGPGPDLLTIFTERGARVFSVLANVTVSLSGMTITGTSEGGIENNGTLTLTNCALVDCFLDQRFAGAGIISFGPLTMVQCSVLNCNAYGSGGGISSSGPLILRQCVISGNLADEGVGGGVAAFGHKVIIDSCTINDNLSADAIMGTVGGGIYIGSGTLLVTNSTISGNLTGYFGEGGGIYAGNSSVQLDTCTIVSNRVVSNEMAPVSTRGGGVSIVNSSAQVRNTIIAQNSSILFLPPSSVPSDFSGVLNSLGYNLIKSLSGVTLTGDLTGCLFSVDPKVGPLADNGGPALTHALLPSSPAIDHGSSSVLTNDQRGFRRPCDIFGYPNASDGSDIGAFEFCPQFIAVEAESGILAAPMVVGSDPLASGGKYIASPVNNAGSASWTITIPISGTYVIWARLNAPTFSSDSFFVSIDGGPELIYDAAENIQANGWQWTRVIGRASGAPVNLNPRLFSLSAGVHTLVFRGRDPDTKLDRLLITSDLNFVPPIGLDAELGTIYSPMAILPDSRASRGKYIASIVPESGQAAYAFGIPATNQYFVWARILATNANADSFYVSMDFGPELIFDVAEGRWTNQWQWSRLIGRNNGGVVNFTPRTFNLDQSIHTLIFRTREANSKLDRIVVTSDSAFDPSIDFDQTITNQNVSGFANMDLVIWLWENSPHRDLAIYTLSNPPAAGTLYQYVNGSRGPALSPGQLVTDPEGRIIFAPAPDTVGLSYASFQFVATDSIRDPAQVTTTIAIVAPPVSLSPFVASDKSFYCRFTGIPHTTYSILSSTNLTQATWTRIQSAIELSSGLYEFTDPAPISSARFFRVSWP